MDANLVDVLDRTVALYGPTLAALLKENPEASGITTFVGRSEPSALLKDEGGRGYGDDQFEPKACAALAPLSSEHLSIQESCPATRDLHEPIGVDIDRVDGGVVVTATVSDRLGAVFVRRKAVAIERNDFAFFCLPAEIAIFAFSHDEDKLRGLERVSREGFHRAMDFAIGSGIVLNRKGAETAILREFANQFPMDGSAETHSFSKETTYVLAVSTQDLCKIMATAADRSDFDETRLPGVVIETIASKETDLATDMSFGT